MAHLLVFVWALIHKYQPGKNSNMHWRSYSLEYNGYVGKKFPKFIKLKKLFLWLQKPATETYPEPDDCSPHNYMLVSEEVF